MSFVDSLLALAESTVGIAEATGRNDGIPSTKFMGGRQEAWCGHYIAWLFRQLGFPLPHDVIPSPSVAAPLASVTFMENVFKTDNRLQYIPFPTIPQPGDILFLKNRGTSDKTKSGGGRHVGLIVKVLPEIRNFRTIEGNIPDRVGRVVYSFGNKSVAGVGRVLRPDDLWNPGA